MTSSMEEELAKLRSRYDAQPGGRTFAPLADCYRRLGRLDEALDICLEGLDRHETYSTARVILGKIHRDRNEPEAALRAFEQVVEIDEMNLVARRECALLSEELGEVRRAYEHWNRLLAADPDGVEAEAAIERLAASPELAVASAADVPERVVEPPRATALEAQLDETPVVEEEERTIEEVAPPVVQELPQDEEPAADENARAEKPEGRVKDARGIATITLARIYYDQGFKAKALDVYERVLAENPEDAELARRVETIRAELEQLESRATDRAADGSDMLDAEESTPPSQRLERQSKQPVAREEAAVSREVDELTASIEAADPRREDFSQFRNWLSRVQDDDKD